MVDTLLLIGCCILLIAVLVMLIMVLRRRVDVDLSAIDGALRNIEGSYDKTERAVRDEIARNREESSTVARSGREEMAGAIKAAGDTLNQQMAAFVQSTDTRLEATRNTVEQRLDLIQRETTQKLDAVRLESSTSAQKARDEVNVALRGFGEQMTRIFAELASVQRSQLGAVTEQVGKLSESNQQRLDSLRSAVEGKLQLIQEDNAKQLEQMRLTVDEKLQGTLERRLGESFKQVSERLEAVSRGLGEMQVLAAGVGDLKKVLTNVKTRGTWGEVQLGAMLEQVLHPEQYAQNVDIAGKGERVEYAVRLPGRGEDGAPVWLPIDAKFPVEDYQRLMDAQERADAEDVEQASRQLENRIKDSAWDICTKYVHPPESTDFGILFLPTEGLFAEIIRRTGLAEFLQRECRVIVAGPTTLWSILNSLQMGFRTLAIQKSSSEVWKLLGAVKTEWSKYGEVLERVQKKLQEASNTIDQAQVRSRAIGRTLKGVEQLPSDQAQALLPPVVNGTGIAASEALEEA